LTARFYSGRLYFGAHYTPHCEMPFKDPNSPRAKASYKRRFARWYAKNRARCLARMKERYRNKKAMDGGK
jgi:hypothetical protein